MVTFKINDSGNLEITLTEEGKEWLTEKIESEANDEQLFLELIETQLCNGYHIVQPEQIGALTSSLLIADGILDDETTEEDANNTNVWYYNLYAVRSYLADLKEYGLTTWNKA